VFDDLVRLETILSQAVDRLEAAGLCVRRPNPLARRSSIVQPAQPFAGPARLEARTTAPRTTRPEPDLAGGRPVAPRRPEPRFSPLPAWPLCW